MENLIKLFSNLFTKNENATMDLSALSSIMPVLSSMMENNKKDVTEVTPEILSKKLNDLIHTSQ